MTLTRHTDQRIKAGWTTQAVLTATYAVSAIPTQTDQDIDQMPWVLDARLHIPVKYQRLAATADQRLTEDGGLIGQWGFSFMSFAMVYYWKVTLLAGLVSAPVTIMDYDDQETAKYIQCYMQKAILPGDGEWTPGGWKNVIWRWVGGVIAPAS
jgi:hypothetical protein